MKGDIRLSEKYGINPALGLCFWCGKDDGTVLLVGRLPGDKEAPRHMLASYDPCTACKEQFSRGILLIEVRESPNFENQPPIDKNKGQGVYPTGSFVVVRDETVTRLFSEEVAQAVIRKRKAHVDQQVWELLGFSEAIERHVNEEPPPS